MISTTVYTYDATGNRLTKTVDGSSAEGSGPQADVETVYTYDANDRMISDGMNTYTYDNNGNTLSDETVAAGYGSQADTKTYTYDSKNRLTKKNICIYCDLPLRSLLRSQPDTEMTLQ